jgi:hypothetical protein
VIVDSAGLHSRKSHLRAFTDIDKHAVGAGTLIPTMAVGGDHREPSFALARRAMTRAHFGIGFPSRGQLFVRRVDALDFEGDILQAVAANDAQNQRVIGLNQRGRMSGEIYVSAPTFGRHRSNFLSARSTTSVAIMPLMANMRTPTKTLSVWNVAPATVIINPMPAVAA